MSDCKIFLGMSGGVDSSVSALLLKKQGYDVQGVTLLLKPPSPERDRDVQDAKAAAEAVGIPLHIVDRSKAFGDTVMRYFVREYQCGRTPNPCVLCNPQIKFASLSAFAEQNGGGMIATGHYADIFTDERGVRRIKKNPTKKDQSYFLCRLDQKTADSVIFPLGKMSKEDVRALAEKFGIPCAKKGDSQEVCFIPDNDYGRFLTEYGGLKPIPGNFTDTQGNILGQHRGIIYYTRGQRRGLEIALGERMYVSDLNPSNNTVTLCREEERYITQLYAKDLTFIDGREPAQTFTAEVKIRSTARSQPATIEKTGECWKITLSERQTFAAPGQSVALYDGDILLGGGTIQ